MFLRPVTGRRDPDVLDKGAGRVFDGRSLRLLATVNDLTPRWLQGNRKIFCDRSHFGEPTRGGHVLLISPLVPHPPQSSGDPIPEAPVHHCVNGGLKGFGAGQFPARKNFARSF